MTREERRELRDKAHWLKPGQHVEVRAGTLLKLLEYVDVLEVQRNVLMQHSREDAMTDIEPMQLRERAEALAHRAHTAELALADLKAKYQRLERDRNALLAELRDLAEEHVKP